MICACVIPQSREQAKLVARTYPMTELRLDSLALDSDAMSEMEKASQEGVVVTCRRGGMSESERLEVYRGALSAGVRYIDIDYFEDLAIFNELKDIVKQSSTKLILSYHNNETTAPASKLREYIEQMFSSGAYYAKIACRCNSIKDTSVLMSLYNSIYLGRLIIIGLGAAGLITRAAALKLGAEFTYAATDEYPPTADGQPGYSELKKIADAIDSISK